MKRSAKVVLWIVGIFLAVMVLSLLIPPSPAQKAVMEKAEAEKAAAETAEAAKVAEDRRTGVACLSVWNGSHRGLVDSVKANLREPKSFEHVETRIGPVDARGHNKIVMQYRARNGFGGMNLAAVVGTIDNATCDVLTFQSLE